MRRRTTRRRTRRRRKRRKRTTRRDNEKAGQEGDEAKEYKYHTKENTNNLHPFLRHRSTVS